MDGVFEALAAPARRHILELLREGERSTGDLVQALQDRAPMSQPGVSQHLAVLRDARLVAVRTEGRRRLHALDATGIDVAQAWLAWLDEALDPFSQPLDALATEVARGRRAGRGAGGAAQPSGGAEADTA